MLKFYYNPFSGNVRRVWVMLLEKHIPFESILVNLDDDQFGNDFTAVNPLQRIPAIVDNGFRVIESLAILDYLEAKYPTPSLMPSEPENIAIVRMVEMLAVSELQPSLLALTRPLVGLEVDNQKLDAAKERVISVMQFYENLLGRHSYFVGEDITLADIVAGTLVPLLTMFGFSLDAYPRLKAWSDQLAMRESWQQTTPLPEVLEAALPNIRKILERRL
ncbi:glutathione S-transferase family protein [Phormidium sp. CLA17]|uniref:glutathione S-transferase family protein n=1 Tax=Leptolyngbya sp. Cla-17 TaxID=2803751 RepID=UPI001492CEA7|nr:glutathione S-transferase family protein [Leptolyngbya sp. Cla-17]MBM0740328.1 glutathione S-transferase family protein [Leptolyngbya sp. Cla-17]